MTADSDSASEGSTPSGTFSFAGFDKCVKMKSGSGFRGRFFFVCRAETRSLPLPSAVIWVDGIAKILTSAARDASRK
jgi:hypothetical protein